MLNIPPGQQRRQHGSAIFSKYRNDCPNHPGASNPPPFVSSGKVICKPISRCKEDCATVEEWNGESFFWCRASSHSRQLPDPLSLVFPSSLMLWVHRQLSLSYFIAHCLLHMATVMPGAYAQNQLRHLFSEVSHVSPARTDGPDDKFPARSDCNTR